MWCRSTWILANQEGTIGWYLQNITEHDLRWWPDYRARVYVLAYWDGSRWVQLYEQVGISEL